MPPFPSFGQKKIKLASKLTLRRTLRLSVSNSFIYYYYYFIIYFYIDLLRLVELPGMFPQLVCPDDAEVLTACVREGITHFDFCDFMMRSINKTETKKRTATKAGTTREGRGKEREVKIISEGGNEKGVVQRKRKGKKRAVDDDDEAFVRDEKRNRERKAKKRAVEDNGNDEEVEEGGNKRKQSRKGKERAVENDDEKDQEKIKEGSSRKKRKLLERERTLPSLVPPNLDAGPSESVIGLSRPAYINPKDCEQR
jgi:hypothetical protein